MGSSLRGKKEDECEDVISRLETIIDRDIEDVLRAGYGSLDEMSKLYFFTLQYYSTIKIVSLWKLCSLTVMWMSNKGLKILVSRSVIEITTYGEIIVMHRLLQQVGKKAIHKQESWKRRILIDRCSRDLWCSWTCQSKFFLFVFILKIRH